MECWKIYVLGREVLFEPTFWIQSKIKTASVLKTPFNRKTAPDVDSQAFVLGALYNVLPFGTVWLLCGGCRWSGVGANGWNKCFYVILKKLQIQHKCTAVHIWRKGEVCLLGLIFLASGNLNHFGSTWMCLVCEPLRNANLLWHVNVARDGTCRRMSCRR